METQNYTRATLRVPTGKTFGPQAPKIDANAGVIYGCSVITQGPADGWPFVVDAKTLEQVQSLGEAAADGIQVKIDHGSGFENIVGVMRGFR
ncbi:MAG TPA: hypothetical protein VLT36_21740, partial [Candidatus Dormibacteraeota bacterium]|nr:hypothetical protein [Candidatus Dormibacteraeota bacterium]